MGGHAAHKLNNLKHLLLPPEHRHYSSESIDKREHIAKLLTSLACETPLKVYWVTGVPSHVVPLPVHVQRAPLRKRFLAELALERAVSLVDSLVTREGRLLPEGPPAGGAHKGPLPRVHPHVIHQGEPLRKGLLANLAPERFLARVGPLVDLQVRLVRKRPLAEAAAEGLVSPVRSHVCGVTTGVRIEAALVLVFRPRLHLPVAPKRSMLSGRKIAPATLAVDSLPLSVERRSDRAC
ncbi:unnamed protein product [Ixodes persulcatus]